jgi:hypothetical protein
MCDGLKFESEQGGDPVLQPLLRFPEVWNPTLHALELGSATGLTKGTIIPQKPPPDDNPERWRDAAYSIRRTPRCYSSLANRPTRGLSGSYSETAMWGIKAILGPRWRVAQKSFHCIAGNALILLA